jgi:hypothetical protein
MRIYDLQDQEDLVFAFEVKNFFLARSTACKIASKIPGARILRGPRVLSDFRDDEFCEFELDGVTFVMWEPFGDSDTYWIGPKAGAQAPRHLPLLEAVRKAFAEWKLWRAG